ncbi:MAG: GTPase family protein [Hyphomicrobiaceae bacterium]
MKQESSAIRAFRWILIGAGVLAPIIALVPLGSLWLWQHGLLLYWAIATCITTILAWGLQRWLLKPRSVLPQQSLPRADPAPDDGADPGWTPAEQAAWTEVRKIADTVEPDLVTSREEAMALAQRTVEAVARAMHPNKSEPLLQFTAPEALALVERVSARMGSVLRDSVPLGDRLTLAQLMGLWRWRGAIDIADKAYDVWRVMRMLNPATAATSEIRERLSKELIAWGKTHILKRLLARYVEEVGRAAIDLYSGRLSVSEARLGEHVSSESARDLAADSAAAVAEPLRILVAGQVSVGKSSLINALAQEVRAAADALPTTSSFTPYRLQHAGLPAALMIDSPGLAEDERQRAELLRQIANADLVLWVSAANRADREIDRRTFAAIREHFDTHPERRRPPMLVVLTHVDRLRPFQEWTPPYDLGDTQSSKASSIRSAMEAAGAELGMPSAAIIPVCLAPGIETYNIDAVWAAIAEALPDASRARLVRTLRDARASWDWRRVWSQARSGGRVLFDTLR